MNVATVLIRGDFESLVCLAHAMAQPHDDLHVVLLSSQESSTAIAEADRAIRRLDNISSIRQIAVLNWTMALGVFPMAVADAIAHGEPGDLHTIYGSVVHNTSDRSPTKDERFRARLEQLTNLSLGLAPAEPNVVSVVCPTINMTLGEAITYGLSLPNCRGLLARAGDVNESPRAGGFRQAGVPDPYVIAKWRAGARKLPRSSNYDSVRATLSLEDSETEEAPQA